LQHKLPQILTSLKNQVIRKENEVSEQQNKYNKSMETSTLEASISIKLDKIKKLSAFIVIDITFLQISQPKLNFNSIL